MVETNKLQKTPASIIAYYIINTLAKMSGPSDGLTWPLYDSNLPDGPQVETDAGAIYDTSGVLDNRYMSGEVSQHFGFQLRIRSRDKNVGYTKIEDVSSALDDVKLATFSIGSLDYSIQNISRSSTIVSLGVEPGTKRRFHFTVNYLLTIRETI